jgi:hypothetical protein
LYDADLGRWLAPDPMGQHFSPYLAMSNNPVSYIDPSGGEDKYDISIDLDNIGLSVKYSNYYDYYEDLIFTSWAGDAKSDVQRMKQTEEANAARSFEKSLGQAGLYMLSPITVSAKDGISWSDRRNLQSEINFIQGRVGDVSADTWNRILNKEEMVGLNEYNESVRGLTGWMNNVGGAAGLVYDGMYYGQKYSKFLNANFSSKALQVGSKAAFYLSVPLTIYNAEYDVKTGQKTALEAQYKAGWDITMSGIGMWGGLRDG